MHCLYLFIPKAKTWGCKAATAAALPRCDVIAKVLRGHVETRHLDRRLSLEIFPHRWGRNEWPTTDQNSLNFIAGFSESPKSNDLRVNSKSELWNGIGFILRVENSDPEGAETKSPPLFQTFFYINICWKQNHGDLRFQISFIFPALPSLQGSIKGQSFLPSSFESGFQRRTSQALATGLGKEIYGVKIPWRSLKWCRKENVSPFTYG